MKNKKRIAYMFIFFLISAISLVMIMNPFATATSSGSASSPLGIAKDFNIFVLGDLNMSNTDSEGRVAVGGNGSFQSYSVNSKQVAGENALVVGGNLHFQNGQINGGHALYGGSFTGGSYGIPQGELKNEEVINFSEAGAYLLRASSQLAALSTNGMVEGSGGAIKLIGTDPNLNVFSLDQNIGQIDLDVPNNSTVIINVSGTSRTIGGAGYFGYFMNQPSYILFNYYEATSLTIASGGVKGSLLAPQANISTTYSHIDGTIVGASLSGHIEAHDYPFTGKVPPKPTPSPTPEPTPSPTPEPTPGDEDEEIIEIPEEEIPGGSGINIPKEKEKKKEEIIKLEEEETPLGTIELPQTGESQPIFYYLLGLLIVGIGLGIRFIMSNKTKIA